MQPTRRQHVLTTPPLPTPGRPPPAAQALWVEDDPGFFGGERLISYDPGKMKTITACFVHRHLTLFASNEAFLMHAGWLAYALSLALILTYTDEDQKYSKVALGLFDGAMLEFRVLSAFVLAGFILLVIQSWRERRCHYTNLCATCKALLLCLGPTPRVHTNTPHTMLPCVH